MTVAELIKKLKQVDSALPVWFEHVPTCQGEAADVEVIQDEPRQKDGTYLLITAETKE